MFNQELQPWAEVLQNRTQKYKALLEPDPEPPDIPSQF